VALYLPLLLPLGLELGGFIFLALGLAPRRLEDHPDASEISDAIVTVVSGSEPVTGGTTSATPAKPIAKSASGTKNYYQQRLQRDHPEIAKRVESGEISVYAASVSAGLRKAPAKSAKWTKADAYLESVTA